MERRLHAARFATREGVMESVIQASKSGPETYMSQPGNHQTSLQIGSAAKVIFSSSGIKLEP